MATEHLQPKRKRRWFSFSLKTFLVLVTLFCVLMAFLGSLVFRVNKQKEAVQWVQDYRGIVYYDFEWDPEDGRIDEAKLPGPDWLRELIGLDYLADVVVVEFWDNGTQVSDLKPLRKLPQLYFDTLFAQKLQGPNVHHIVRRIERAGSRQVRKRSNLRAQISRNLARR